MSNSNTDGKNFTIEGWLKAGNDRLHAGDHTSAAGCALEAHNRLRTTAASQRSKAFLRHSSFLGQLCHDILKTPRPVSTADDNLTLIQTLYTNTTVLTIMREHLADHLLLPAPLPLPAVWSDLALSAARQLSMKNPWQARRFAELSYAHPLAREGDKAELRALITTTLQLSLRDEKRSTADMMWDPINELRYAGLFNRDPQLALEYNAAICNELLQDKKSETALNIKMLFLLGMRDDQAEARTIRQEFSALSATSSPREAYNAMLLGRIILDEQIEQGQQLPDRRTRRWLKSGLKERWATLCQKDPANAHITFWEKEFGLPAPKPVFKPV